MQRGSRGATKPLHVVVVQGAHFFRSEVQFQKISQEPEPLPPRHRRRLAPDSEEPLGDVVAGELLALQLDGPNVVVPLQPPQQSSLLA